MLYDVLWEVLHPLFVDDGTMRLKRTTDELMDFISDTKSATSSAHLSPYTWG